MQLLARQDAQEAAGQAQPADVARDTGQGTLAGPGATSSAGTGNDVARPAGRPKGSTNRNRVVTQERINAKADPLGFWIDVSNGKPVRIAGRGKKAVWHKPTLEQVFEAKRMLLRKIMPDLKQTEGSVTVDATITRIESVIVDPASN